MALLRMTLDCLAVLHRSIAHGGRVANVVYLTGVVALQLSAAGRFRSRGFELTLERLALN
jgi:hypothetical protein